jgi:hypothetical protein
MGLLHPTTPTWCPMRTARLLASAAAVYAVAPLSAGSQTNGPGGAHHAALVRAGEPVDLAGVGGVRVTKTGAILFADTKPITLNLAQGREGSVQLVGRMGAGPGEYKSAPSFVGYHGDSVVAYDGALQRWSLLSPTGNFVRLMGTNAQVPTFAHNAAWVADGGAIVLNAAVEGTRGPLKESIGLVLAEMGANARVIRQALNGDLWVASAFTSKQWTVFDRAGRKRTAFNFATPVRIEFANDTVAVGATIDSDDLPQIFVQPIRNMPAGKGKPASRPATSVTEEERKVVRTEITKTLRSMVSRQEGAYAQGASYTTDLSKLKMDIPSGVSITIVEAHKRGWYGVAVDERTRVACAMLVGNSVIGWSEGTPECSR